MARLHEQHLLHNGTVELGDSALDLESEAPPTESHSTGVFLELGEFILWCAEMFITDDERLDDFSPLIQVVECRIVTGEDRQLPGTNWGTLMWEGHVYLQADSQVINSLQTDHAQRSSLSQTQPSLLLHIDRRPFYLLIHRCNLKHKLILLARENFILLDDRNPSAC